MTNNTVTFQTRARTIDHLGRGQIADLPTAISELWKNAYDAYAKDVSLHIFHGSPEIAAIFDDGFGMNLHDFLEKWLVIGTESKLNAEDETENEYFGLPLRPRQGEKGIGRLSTAFIAPVTFVVSKKLDSPFAATLVDWRLFENPFLALDDIRLPVRKFETPQDLAYILPEMFLTLRGNVSPAPGDDRVEYIQGAWERFSKIEKGKGVAVTTQQRLQGIYDCTEDILKCLDEWFVFQGLHDHGTAMIMVGVQAELAAWVRPETPDSATQASMENLRETLNSFTDALSNPRIAFEYEVWAHRGKGNKRVLATDDVFGYEDFQELEHSIYGEFDENGVFEGRVVVFGKDRGVKTLTPQIQLSSDYRGQVGPFRFCIGTFDQDLNNSTHNETQHKRLADMASEFGGIRIYRDGLRVMPYGRPDADFFDIEYRRSKHAGREFWSYRRSFGCVAITSGANPNLRDKAGREGLVDNRARGDMRLLVMDLLKEFSRRYFGTDSEIRKKERPEIKKRNLAARKSAENARKRGKKNLRSFLKENQDKIAQCINEVQSVRLSLRVTTGADELAVHSARIKNLMEEKPLLRPLNAPPAGDNLEDKYRKYRDQYNEFSAELEGLSKNLADLEAEFGVASPEEAAKSAFSSRQSRLSARVDGYLSGIKKRQEELFAKWSDEAQADRGKYYQQCVDILNEGPEKYGLAQLINYLDVNFRELEEDISIRYESYLKNLEELEAGINLDDAFSVVDRDLIRMEEHVKNLNAVAQLGISVEIIGHELETMDQEARRNLKRLPDDVKNTAAYKAAMESLIGLTDRLRFLAPLKIAGYRTRERILGEDIEKYVKGFFGNRFRDDKINFYVTESFRQMVVTDLPSRIFPVFINLINNAAYWVTFSTERIIKIDVLEDVVIIADSGPGVDTDDQEMLFSLFFTKKQGGRGVGLYLSKANLSVGGHSIYYARDEKERLLSGANFVIQFKGMEHVG